MQQYSSMLSDIGAETLAMLDRYGFDPQQFELLRRKLASGELSEASNRLRARIEPPAAGDIRSLPSPGTKERAALKARGEEAIRDGKIAAIILAGGMATRFGGVVKASVPVTRGRTFLDLKIADLRAAAVRTGGRVPTRVMTSFATDAEVSRLAQAQSGPTVPIETFAQMASLRLTTQGELFRGADGGVSPYAPGHGDLPFALRRSGALARLREAGATHAYISNVDNLAATFEPAIIGAHLRDGRPITVEVADKAPGDKGGAPARVAGRLQIVEGFRFPPEFDHDSIASFNTNTLIIDLAALEQSFDLSWFVVKKEVEGKRVVQFERLVHELTAFLPSQMLGVSREGPDGRFMPVKDPGDLEARRASIERLLAERGIV